MSVHIRRLFLLVINRESQLARIRFPVFRRPASRPVKPCQQQLAHPKAHHAVRVDYHRFAGTRITPLPSTLLLGPTPFRLTVLDLVIGSIVLRCSSLR